MFHWHGPNPLVETALTHVAYVVSVGHETAAFGTGGRMGAHALPIQKHLPSQASGVVYDAQAKPVVPSVPLQPTS